jgi:hypothetical protein
MMIDHFEDVWGLCEELHIKEGSKEMRSSSSLIDELNLKLQLYKAYLGRDLKDQEQKVKEALIGELLFTLTALSLHEDINVFKSLLDTYLQKNQG